jgi:hypothetical protein
MVNQHMSAVPKLSLTYNVSNRNLVCVSHTSDYVYHLPSFDFLNNIHSIMTLVRDPINVTFEQVSQNATGILNDIS